MASIEAGIDAYFEASFEEALPLLTAAMQALLDGRDQAPVPTGMIVRDAVFLVLALHALGRDGEAGAVAQGLAAIAAPPWGLDLDISKDARQFLDVLGAKTEPPAAGTVVASLPAQDCSLLVDGETAGKAGEGSADVFEGPHWIGAACGHDPGPAHLVEVPAGGRIEIDLSAGMEAGTEEVDEAAGKGKADLILDLPALSAAPWYGDGWNLALEIVGVAVVTAGAGLLAGGIHVDAQARTKATLGYAGMEQEALRLEASGWVLLGTGTVFLAIGVFRMAVMARDREDGA